MDLATLVDMDYAAVVPRLRQLAEEKRSQGEGLSKEAGPLDDAHAWWNQNFAGDPVRMGLAGAGVGAGAGVLGSMAFGQKGRKRPLSGALLGGLLGGAGLGGYGLLQHQTGTAPPSSETGNAGAKWWERLFPPGGGSGGGRGSVSERARDTTQNAIAARERAQTVQNLQQHPGMRFTQPLEDIRHGRLGDAVAHSPLGLIPEMFTPTHESTGYHDTGIRPLNWVLPADVGTGVGTALLNRLRPSTAALGRGLPEAQSDPMRQWFNSATRGERLQGLSHGLADPGASGGLVAQGPRYRDAAGMVVPTPSWGRSLSNRLGTTLASGGSRFPGLARFGNWLAGPPMPTLGASGLPTSVQPDVLRGAARAGATPTAGLRSTLLTGGRFGGIPGVRGMGLPYVPRLGVYGGAALAHNLTHTLPREYTEANAEAQRLRQQAQALQQQALGQ